MTQPQSKHRLRWRSALDRWFPVLVLLAIILVLAGGFLTYGAFLGDNTELQEFDREIGSMSAGYSHSAEVIEPNPVFPVGDDLTDRSSYFTTIAPILDIEVETAAHGQQADDIEIELVSELVLRGTDDDQVLWDQTDELDATVTDADPGEFVSIAYSINVSEIDDELSAIGDALGSPGSMEAVIETTVVFSGTFEGQTVSHVEQLDLAVDPAGDRYNVEDPGMVTEQFTTTETEVVEQEPDLLGMIGGPMLLLIGLVGAGSLAFVRHKRLLALTPHERAYLRYLDDRSEFEDWINRITLPDATLDRPVAEADRLRDLVDFALDNDTGVIEDTQTGEYHVLTSDVRYTFDPPEPEPTPSLTLPDFEEESTDPDDEEA